MLTLRVNQVSHDLDVDPDTPLLWVLREQLGLTGTKYSCGVAQCGACTVHVDGQPLPSCMVKVGMVVGREITTIEGIFQGKVGQAVKRAWIAKDVPQCGYCQSGQFMTAVGLLSSASNVTEAEINGVMSSVLCRCGTYLAIRRAILRASKELSQ